MKGALTVSEFTKSVFRAAVFALLGAAASAYVLSRKRRQSEKALKKALGELAEKGADGVRIDCAKVGSVEEEFNKTAESLCEREKKQSTFLNTVAHDLRTPATCISGFAEGMLDGTIPPEKRDHYIGVISAESKRMGRLVETLLEVARIEAGTKKYTAAKFDICETARLVLISLESKIDGKKLDVSFDAPESAFAYADSDAVHRVIYNLCDNAVKFSDEGGKLCVSVKPVGEKIEVSVYNTGKGISAEDLPHVFDRFYKADPSKGLDSSGAGLGLYIVKSTVEGCGGSVSVESEEGKWCRFTVSLPAAK